jgi:glycosyltransferase involved in cell wall biosynthesis
MGGPVDSPSYPGVSVVVPSYKSSGTLGRLCDELERHVGGIVDELELILVDDGSGDDTWPTIERLAANRQWVRGLALMRNYGQHNALLAGLRQARLPLVVTMDDDLQNRPDAVPALLAALTDDVDLVYATPTERPHSAFRNLASAWTKRWMALALGPDVHPQSGAFRLFRRELVRAGADVHDPSISIDVILSWATKRVTTVEVPFAEREDGRSGYTFRKLLRHTMNMVTGYSTRPLRWATGAGMVFALLGFAMLVFVLTRYAIDSSTVPGFTFLAAAITLFSGIQLVSLGMIGEYLGRVHVRTLGRPPYVVRTTSDHRSAERGTEHAGADE